MKILHIISDPSSETGGLASSLRNIAETQAQFGHHVEIASTDSGSHMPVFKNIKYHSAHCTWHAWRWSKGFANLIGPLLSRTDIVHLHGIWEYPIYVSALLCHQHRLPHIVSLHGMLHRWSLSQKRLKKILYLQTLGKKIISHAHAIHFTSYSEAMNSYPENLKEKGFVCPLGIASDAYKDLPPASVFRQRYPQIKDKKIILYLGRLHYKKRPELLIASLPQILSHFSDTVLVFAGTGESCYVRQLNQRVQELKLYNRVIFTGYLSGRSVQEAYRAADVFVLPSLQENFGYTIFESLAAGCPVIISDRIDAAEEIRNAHAGWICQPDVQSISSAIVTLLSNKKLCQTFCENGRKLILRKYTSSKTVATLVGIYQDILQNKRSSTAWLKQRIS